MMMNCNEATRLMSDGRERPLTFRERASIRVHTMMCAGCSNFNVQVELLGAIARRYAKEEGEDSANDLSTKNPDDSNPE